MDVDDDTRDGSASSVILESMGSTQQGDKLSDDDLAWVNSCLVSDTEILESNWTSFKDVLLEIIGDQREPLDSSETKTNGFLGGTEINIVPSIEEAETADYSGRIDDDDLVIPIVGDDETTTDIIRTKIRIGTRLQFLQEDSAETFQGDPFCSTYKEDEITDNAVDLGVQSSLSAEEMNSLIADIFRVWDLYVPDEEGDLMKELNKVVAETTTSSSQPMPLAFDDSTAWKGLEDEQDHLISGIANLSINTNML